MYGFDLLNCVSFEECDVKCEGEGGGKRERGVGGIYCLQSTQRQRSIHHQKTTPEPTTTSIPTISKNNSKRRIDPSHPAFFKVCNIGVLFPFPAMGRKKFSILMVVALAVVIGFAAAPQAASKKVKVCDKGWECSNSIYCCNETITDFFQVYQFENLFAKRNAPVAHAVGFWDYHSFITAAALFEPLGFGTTGGKQMQMKEVAAFLGHVGSKTSCGYGVATGGPLAWGLCYNHEMSPSQSYCDDSNYIYPCTPGVDYYGRGALPVYWNYNYGVIGEGIKVDLLNHPEYLEQNATIAFQAAMWRWMTPMKKKQPSAHDVFVGNWKPTKNDTLSNRFPGFGATMNILYGDVICGQGFIDSMNNIISHYQYYLDLMGISRDYSGDNLDCADQVAFNPSAKSTSASS